MKTRNRILSLLVLLCLLVGLLPSAAFAASQVASGTCGANLTWVLDSNGALTISGTGEMTDYESYDSTPWFECRNQIKTAVIEDGVASIVDMAFNNCQRLTSVTISSSVTAIGELAFFACLDLTAIKVDTGNANYCSQDGVLFNKDMTELITYPEGKTGGYVIPDGVNTIGKLAFYNCGSLTSVTIPSSVTTIGDEAFYKCESLKSVTIPSSVTTIGDYAFSWCTGLTSVTIPSSVTTIGEHAFSSCESLTSVTIPSSVTTIGKYAFSSCESLTSVTIPSSVTTIGKCALGSCSSLTAIEVDTGNANYCSQDGVLFNKDMTELITYPEGKTGGYVIPDGVNTIGDYAFSGCIGLTSVTIPSSVTTIGHDAFEFCKSLTSLTIPEGVTTIGDWAFCGCTGLTEITFEGDTPIFEIDEDSSAPNPNTFKGVTATAYYPTGNKTWTEDVMQDYGGTITWTPYSVEIYADVYDFYTDSYDFVNYGEKISKKYFTTLYGAGPGTLLYKLQKDAGKSGLCFGMAYTTAAIYNGLPDCSQISTFDGSLFQYKSCENIREIVNWNLWNIYSAFVVGGNTISVEDYIKYAYIYQWSSEVAKSTRETWGDIEGLYNTVKAYTDEGKIGVTIGLTHFELDSDGKLIVDEDGNYKTSGHRVLAVGYEGKTILIDDPNNTDSIERLVINDDWTWTYSGGWTSDGVTSDNSVTRYQVDYYRPYDILLTGNSASTYSSTEDKVETYIEGMEVIDASSLLAYIDCEAISELPQNLIEVVDDMSLSTEDATDDGGMLYWAENANSLSLSEISGEDNEIILAGGNAILSASFGCVTDYVGTIGDGEANIRFDGEAGEGCTVTYTTIFNDVETELEITGEIQDASIEVRTVDGGVEVLGLSSGTVTITTNDETTGSQDFQADTNAFTVYYDEQGEDTALTLSYKTDDGDDADDADNADDADDADNADDADDTGRQLPLGLYIGIAVAVAAVAAAAITVVVILRRKKKQ